MSDELVLEEKEKLGRDEKPIGHTRITISKAFVDEEFNKANATTAENKETLLKELGHPENHINKMKEAGWL